MIVVHVPHESQRSKDLAQELRATIAGFQHRQPKTTLDEVRMALAAATPAESAIPARRIATILTIVGLTVVVAMIALFMGTRENGRPIPWIIVTTGIGLSLGVIGLAWAWARNDE